MTQLLKIVFAIIIFFLYVFFEQRGWFDNDIDSLSDMSLVNEVHLRNIVVVDGDSLKGSLVEKSRVNRKEVRLRLFGIDAPEFRQEYGREAKRELQRMINRSIRFEAAGKDKYGRTLVVMRSDGANLNFELVRLGAAWCLQNAGLECQKIQLQAEKEQKGLWQNESPVPPWRFRKGERVKSRTSYN